MATKEDEGVLQKMIWPAQSQDVNPIELLWDELDRQVRDLAPTSESSMWDCLKKVWDNLDQQILRKLVERMPKICAAIIKSKGGHFNEKTLA